MTWPVFLIAAVILTVYSVCATVMWQWYRAIVRQEQETHRLLEETAQIQAANDALAAEIAATSQLLKRIDALERTDPGHRIAEAIRAHRFDRAGELPGFTAGMRTAAFIADDITGNDPIKQQEEQT